MTRRIMLCLGTRPEAIKMVPVLRALRGRPGFTPILCVTGQHRDMVGQVLDLFGETADVDLGLMQPGQGLSALTAAIMQAVSAVIERVRPDLLLVHGDTATAFAAGVAGFHARVPVGHVEAGLRSHDLAQPWPEEFYRVAVDCMAALMFAPTEQAAAALRREYNQRGRIIVTGNTGIDALMLVSARLEHDAAFRHDISRRWAWIDPSRRLVLVTGHRRESFGAGFARICEGLRQVAGRDDVELLYPLHPNPQAQAVVRERLAGVPRIHLVDAIGYAETVYLMRRAALVITDSGGIQEEAPALGKPVLVMREVTERPEALACGALRLVGTDVASMQREVGALLDDPAEYARRARPVFPYGDGQASGRIVQALEAYWPA